MPSVSLIRRIAILAVALHLAALPVSAALHEASHYRFENGVALENGAEPCADRGAPGHRSHWDRARDAAADLLCEVCQTFQQGLQKQSDPRQPPMAPALNQIGLFLPAWEAPPASPCLALPHSRSPPRSA